VEVSALKHVGPAGIHGRSPLLRLQSDERLIALVRRGNHGAFEALVGRYSSRLLAFCRHMLGSREDAEDVLQEVFAAAYNAILADSRAINVRPWLYRIARNRSLNHLRRTQAVGMDSMDVHFSDGGLSTADQVHRREEFRQLVSDVGELPETQRTALLLREIDALSYEQIAEAMDTTVPSVKSLLVRARVALAEAAEARLLSCEEVRYELGEVAEGLRRLTPPARRHIKSCQRCAGFQAELRKTTKALAAIMPVGPLLLFKKLLLAHLGTTAASHGGGAAAGTAVGTAAGGAAASTAGSAAAGSALSYGVTAVAGKAAAGLAAAALVTAGAVEVKHVATERRARPAAVAQVAPARAAAPVQAISNVAASVKPRPVHHRAAKDVHSTKAKPAADETGGTPAAVVLGATPPPGPQSQSDTTTLPADPTTLSGQTGGSVGPAEPPPPPPPPPAPPADQQPAPATAQPAPAPAPAPTPPADPGTPPAPPVPPAPPAAGSGDGTSPAPATDPSPSPPPPGPPPA
jgi:RNA polymerase sigma factor (sigma-70 family)